jgi:hypothetical protein
VVSSRHEKVKIELIWSKMAISRLKSSKIAKSPKNAIFQIFSKEKFQ